MALEIGGIPGSGSSGVTRTSSGGARSQGNSGLDSVAKALMGQTAQYKKMQAERFAELAPNRAQRADYSKDAAFADAQGLMQQQLRQAMERSMSTLSRSAEGAGASQGALRALLAQRASQEAADSAAAAGANLAVEYGGIANQSSGILEALTRGDNGGLMALIAALQQRGGQGGTGGQGPVSRPASNPQRTVIGNSGSVGARDSQGKVTASVAPSSRPADTSAFFNRADPYGPGFFGGPSITGDQFNTSLAQMLVQSPWGAQDSRRDQAGMAAGQFGNPVVTR